MHTYSKRNNLPTAVKNVLSDSAFERLIFKSYSKSKNYDKIRHNILNIRQSMSDRHICFKSMSKKRQFEYCETIGLIVIQTNRQHMNENRPLYFPENKRYEYSIDRDWKEAKYI